MSLFSALSVSLSGLTSATAQLQVCSNNIANATTAGYTRKTANVSSAVLGNEGGGVQVSGYSRATDEALAKTLNLALGNASFRATQNEYFEQVQTILGSSSSSDPALSEAVAGFAAAWGELAASPESSIYQNQVIQAAQTLASQVQTIATNVESLDKQCLSDINSTLVDLNANLASIADLNEKIQIAQNAGLDSGNLEDDRDLLVQEVAAVMNINVMDRANGTIALYTPAGYCLLDGEPQSFYYNGTTVYATTNSTMSLNDVLTGGSLEALVQFRATATTASSDVGTNVIQKLRDQLDAIAEAFTGFSTSPASFAAAYNGLAAVSDSSGCITFASKTSGTFGNDITITITDAGGGNYTATVSVPGQADETYTVAAAADTNAFWSALATQINAGSRLITATATSVTSATNPSTLPAYSLSGGAGDTFNGIASVQIQDGMLVSAIVEGADGNDLSITLSVGTTLNTFKATVTDGTTTETYDNISGGGATLWQNIVDAINTTPSQFIMATSLGGTSSPLSATYSLTGGGTSASASYLLSNAIEFTAQDTGVEGNDITVKVALGSTAGHYTVTVSNGETTETYTNIDGTSGTTAFWANVATAINASSTLVSSTTIVADTAPQITTYAFTGGSDGPPAVASTATQTGSITFIAATAGAAGDGITVDVAAAASGNPGEYDITITDGVTTETYTDVPDSGADHSGFWANFVTAINSGWGADPPSTLISALPGATTIRPLASAATTYSLSGGEDELETGFFTGTDRNTFAVNEDLVNGTVSLKADSVAAVVDAFNVVTRSFSADGLSVENVSYSTLITGILSGFQQAARTISTLSDGADTQKTYLEEKLTNEVGVNTDTEIEKLTVLENSYAASARVISVIQELFDTLLGLL